MKKFFLLLLILVLVLPCLGCGITRDDIAGFYEMKLSESTIDGKSYTKADENLLNALDTGVYLYIKNNGEGAIHLFDEDYSIHFYPLFEKAIIDESDESSYIINFTYENKKLMLISANTDTQFVLYKSNKSAPYSLTSLANRTSKSLPVPFSDEGLIKALIVNILLCIVVGFISYKLNRGFWGYFGLSLIISPIITFIILLFKGKLTREKIYDTTSHMYYCVNCNKMIVGKGLAKHNQDFCNSCQKRLIETDIFDDVWDQYNSFQKEQVIQEIKMGKHHRNQPVVTAVIQPNTPEPNMSPNAQIVSPADEIEKYKNLFDKGIITQEEFEAKKKKLLDL